MVSVVDFMVRNFKNQGAPVDHIWPVEGAVLVPTPIGITASSKNPDAARAFLRYLYSPEGQRLFVKQGYVAVLPGIEPPQGAPSLADVRIAPTAEAFIAANREELKARFQSLFGG
jgi:iron(III) transport system substrate-binding protein